MDVYCKKCGEPWGLPLDMTFAEQRRFLRGEGCPCCDWGRKAPPKPPAIVELQAALESVLGDDLDGLAAELEDAMELWMLFEPFDEG